MPGFVLKLQKWHTPFRHPLCKETRATQISVSNLLQCRISCSYAMFCSTGPEKKSFMRLAPGLRERQHDLSMSMFQHVFLQHLDQIRISPEKITRSKLERLTLTTTIRLQQKWSNTLAYFANARNWCGGK